MKRPPLLAKKGVFPYQRSAAVVGILAVLSLVFSLVGSVFLVAYLVSGVVHTLAGAVFLIIGHDWFTSFIFCGEKRCTPILADDFGIIRATKTLPFIPFSIKK